MADGKPTKLSRRFKDRTGQQFGRLIAVARDCSRKGTYWTCACSCGNTCVVSGSNLNAGKQVSCGCLKNEKAAERHTSHGLSRTGEYGVWCGIKKRCFNLKDKAYPNYGGRGITMCERWDNSFEAFLEDMGPRPIGMSIERLNNDKNYEPGNCAWVSRKAQNRNTRKNVWVTQDGQTRTLAEWSELSGISYGALQDRYRRGVIPIIGRMRRLTNDERREIKMLYRSGGVSHVELAVRFGVGRQTICNIVNRE